VPSYNYDHDPSHGYGSDTDAYARFARSHPSHRGFGYADTGSWSVKAVLQASMDSPHYAEAVLAQETRRTRNGVIISRLLFAGLFLLIAIMCAIGTDAAIRGGVGGLNHVHLMPVHVACRWVYVQHC
jgi:hypothetical protein